MITYEMLEKANGDSGAIDEALASPAAQLSKPAQPPCGYMLAEAIENLRHKNMLYPVKLIEGGDYE